MTRRAARPRPTAAALGEAHAADRAAEEARARGAFGREDAAEARERLADAATDAAWLADEALARFEREAAREAAWLAS